MMTAKAKRAVLLVLAGGIALGLWTHTDQYHCLRVWQATKLVRVSRGGGPGNALDAIHLGLWKLFDRRLDSLWTTWETHMNALVASGYLRKYPLPRTNAAVTERELLERAVPEIGESDGPWTLRARPSESNIIVTCRPDAYPRWKKLVEDVQTNL
jgi:hypothetical protein